MKKIIFPILLLIFLNGCTGYKPIFSSTNLQFKISNHSIEGNEKIGNKIFTKLKNASKSAKNDVNATNVSIVINSTKSRNATAKNSAGKILEYKITLDTVVKITDFITKDIILNQNLISSVTYKAQEQYSDTIKLENKSLENLINNTYQELLIKLSQKVATK